MNGSVVHRYSLTDFNLRGEGSDPKIKPAPLILTLGSQPGSTAQRQSAGAPQQHISLFAKPSPLVCRNTDGELPGRAWWGGITTVMFGFAVLGPGIIVLIDGGQSRLVALGLANLITLTTIYFFFGVVGFFFYFLFAPMPPYVHAGGFALGLAMTGYWMVLTARDVNKALVTSHFVQDAFEETGSVLQYRLKNIGKLEAVVSSRSPFGKLHMYLVLLIAPLSLVIGRVLAPVFGPHGPILLGALILFPVSQWIAGIGIRQYIVMVRLPRMLERTQGKPVIVVNDERCNVT